jgi:cystathionine beta-lyase/cystathionine gamma-synthase
MPGKDPARERSECFGCVETVVGPPVTTSHVECGAEERAAAGLPGGLVRYATGIEDIEGSSYEGLRIRA